MSLTIRKRGAKWHARGTVRVGRETRNVKEHSTGCDRKEDAQAYLAKLETELRNEILYGRDGRAHRLTIADAGLRYINRPGGVPSYDMWRIDEINDRVGDFSIARAADAWSEFEKARCGGLAPSTVNRFFSVFSSALNTLCRAEQIEVPKIIRKRGKEKVRVRFLQQKIADRVIDSYADHVRPIALTLRYQGMRVGEALRVDWSHIGWQSSSIYIPESKNGEARTVNMHAKVRRALHRLWVGCGSPEIGRVFLNRLGKPYADPRTYDLPGGSPIRKAHATACARAGVTDFHVHDWRHHWASHCVMAGIDLETIRHEGGWKSLRMVEKYAAVSAKHRAQQMRKLK